MKDVLGRMDERERKLLRVDKQKQGRKVSQLDLKNERKVREFPAKDAPGVVLIATYCK